MARRYRLTAGDTPTDVPLSGPVGAIVYNNYAAQWAYFGRDRYAAPQTRGVFNAEGDNDLHLEWAAPPGLPGGQPVAIASQFCTVDVYAHSQPDSGSPFSSPSMINPMTSAGDIIIGGGSGAPQRLGIGATGSALEVVAGLPAWVALGKGQSAGATITGNITTTSLTFADAAGLTVNITPTGGDVLIWFSGVVGNGGAGQNVNITLAKDGTNVGGTLGLTWYIEPGGSRGQQAFVWRDPAPTQVAHIYKVQWLVSGNTGTIYGNPTASLVVQEVSH